MKIVADEGVERAIVVRLRAEGHQVIYIAEMAPSSTDPEVLEIVNREEALLITPDKDFGDLIFHQYYQAPGVILLRLPNDLSALEKADMVVDVIKEYREKLLLSFTVISVNKRRMIRILPKQSQPETD